MRHNLRWIASVGCAACLTGCSLASSISRQSMDYNTTVEDVTNDMLVTNVLRGRDQAPLFFSDLSQIRGSIALNLSAQDSFPWGPQYKPITGTGVRRSAQIGPVAVNTNPTFDIAPLNTKQFSQGVLEPISKNILAYYLRRGVDANVILRLLVSRIDEIRVTGERASVIKSYSFKNQDFSDLIERWTRLGSPRGPQVKVSASPQNFGPPLGADPKAVVEAAANGLEVKPATARGKVQFTKKSSHLTLCMPNAAGDAYVAVGFVPNSVIKTPQSDPLPNDDDCNTVSDPLKKRAKRPGRQPVSTTSYLLQLRSVQGLFYYLGDVVSKNRKPPPGAIPFFVYDHPVANVRFSVDYRGQTYYVAESSDSDYTITVLQVLNDLLNLNRDANEIPATKAVQAVGGQ
jgi:hypothetical protein